MLNTTEIISFVFKEVFRKANKLAKLKIVGHFAVEMLSLMKQFSNFYMAKID